ncbi:hypothetical protein G7Y89_g14621 [Cudoniella acicularis]|uniref:2EXR domain-containing protein n=1 Tax=Cudoniella acicularis TaxID=354080 RepID=A0A8H4R0V8_9HELO|nr:hypothetical protein G7Y89_g14621 [Cudoniella acicularis]
MAQLEQSPKEPPPEKVDCLGPAKEFKRLRELPIEIRCMIWGFAASVPRHVKLNPCAPAILHTCREARSKGQRYYTLCNKRPQERRRNWVRKNWVRKNWVIWANFDVEEFTVILDAPWPKVVRRRTAPKAISLDNFYFSDSTLQKINRLTVTLRIRVRIHPLADLITTCQLQALTVKKLITTRK